MKSLRFLLCVVLLPCVVKAQNKKFACSYDYPGAPEAGYPPDYIPLEVCTHVIFKGFKFPKIIGRQMVFHDDDKLMFSSLVSSIRKRSSTVVIVASIRGTQNDYSAMAAIGQRRKAFVQLIGTLLLQFDADSVEINWNTPGGTTEFGGSDFDRISMVNLLQDLRQLVTSIKRQSAIREREIWFRVSIHPNAITSSYNVPEVCELADYVTLDAKDVPLGDSHAPLHTKPIALPFGFRIPGNAQFVYDLTDSTQRWITSGCPPKKMLLAIALYGIRKEYQSDGNGFFGNHFMGWNEDAQNRLPYRELCQSFRQYRWTFGWDPYGLMPYAIRRLGNGQDQRVSYDDTTSLSYKMNLVEEQRLGGIYLDYIHNDDIYGRCGQAYPLTSYLSSRLRTIPSDIGFAIEWS
ncbi:endochitinase-like [Anopheles aquasalis]|uniref:endochitinase-like n=1 Tax=Anopheles aquasalis TaxID=42839 RepID=UPI00215B33E2|nr:endochitinase-like [Anopheles aquasalis]